LLVVAVVVDLVEEVREDIGPHWKSAVVQRIQKAKSH
jgi:hypothetical protein